MIKLDVSRLARVNQYQLLRCVLAGGPGLARPFDVEDPPPPIPIQPTITSYEVPDLPAPWSPEETFDEALDRLAYANRKARAELDDRVFILRRKHWLLNGYRDVVFYRATGHWLPQKDNEEIEPIATDKRILDALALGFSAMAMDEEDRHR